MFVYKIDVLSELKKAGYNTGRIRKEHIIPEGTLQHIRKNEMISMQTLHTLCALLKLQPSNIIMYVED